MVACLLAFSRTIPASAAIRRAPRYVRHTHLHACSFPVQPLQPAGFQIYIYNLSQMAVGSPSSRNTWVAFLYTSAYLPLSRKTSKQGAWTARPSHFLTRSMYLILDGTFACYLRGSPLLTPSWHSPRPFATRILLACDFVIKRNQ